MPHGYGYQGTSRWSLWSERSLLSIGSSGSVLSIGSVGSVLSIGSIGSALSLCSIGSALSVGSALSSRSIGSLLSYRSRRAIQGEPAADAAPTVLLGGVAALAAVSSAAFGRRRPGNHAIRDGGSRGAVTG